MYSKQHILTNRLKKAVHIIDSVIFFWFPCYSLFSFNELPMYMYIYMYLLWCRHFPMHALSLHWNILSMWFSKKYMYISASKMFWLLLVCLFSFLTCFMFYSSLPKDVTTMRWSEVMMANWQTVIVIKYWLNTNEYSKYMCAHVYHNHVTFSPLIIVE